MIAYPQVRQFSVRQISELNSVDLKKLKEEADDEYQKAKESREWIDVAISIKYQDRVEKIRQTLDKETGVVHFQDGDIEITADVPKRVTWNQKKLAEIAGKIQEGGSDPSEYIDISYKVPERKYTAWPENLRDSFAPARTLKPGKQTYVFEEASV